MKCSPKILVCLAGFQPFLFTAKIHYLLLRSVSTGNVKNPRFYQFPRRFTQPYAFSAQQLTTVPNVHPLLLPTRKQFYVTWMTSRSLIALAEIIYRFDGSFEPLLRHDSGKFKINFLVGIVQLITTSNKPCAHKCRVYITQELLIDP